MSDTVLPDGGLPELPEEMPEAPASVLDALGVGGAPDTSALDAIRADISRDLETRQGPHRARSPMARMWPMVLAALFLIASFVVLKPAASIGGLHLVACVIAGVAGLLCLIATALAPDRPGAAERISLGGIVAAAAAIAIEGYLAAAGPMGSDAGLKCAMMTAVFAAVPLGLLLFGIHRSGLPVRKLHAASVASAGIAIAGASVWMHCPAEDGLHLLVGHLAAPALIASALAVVLFRLFAKLRER